MKCRVRHDVNEASRSQINPLLLSLDYALFRLAEQFTIHWHLADVYFSEGDALF